MSLLKLGFTAWTLLVLIAGATQNLRAETPPDLPSRADQTNWIARISEKLALSDEQRTKVEPIFKDSFTQQRAVLEKHKGQRSLRALRSLRRELKPIREQTDTQLKTVLTKTQMKELAKLRAEMKDELRDALRERREDAK